MRSALPALLISVALLTGGCSGPSYLRSLELRRSVCDLSYPGVICAQPGSGSGGIGSLAGGFGGSGGTSDLTLSTSEIFDLGTNGGQSFDLAAFQSRLATSIKRDLEHAGYEVSDSAANSGISLQYTSSGVDGRLEIRARIVDERLVVDLSAREAQTR